MANTVTVISYANTFGQWMVATDALIAENNNLAVGDYTKNSGTVYLSETTKNALQSNGNIVVQKQLLVQGIGSSTTMDNNLTVGGQVYFSNATLGLTNSGQANINGLLVAQGPNTSLYVANNEYIAGNSVIQLNLTTSNIQANNTINTSTVSVTGNIYTNNLFANTNITGTTAAISGTTYTNTLKANSSVITVTGFANILYANTIQSNTTIIANTITANGTIYTNGAVNSNTSSANVSTVQLLNANNIVANTINSSNTITGNNIIGVLVNSTYANIGTLSVSTNTFTNSLQANNSVLANTITANTLVTSPTVVANTVTVNQKIDANSASAFVNSLAVGSGGLSISGNFTLTGSTIYAANTFQLSTGVSSAISSYISVARGSSGANAAFRWNEPLKYWETLDVVNSNYNRVLTDQYLSTVLTDTSTSNIASASTANTLNNLINTANTYLQASISALNSYSTASYASQNITAIFANSAFTRANNSTNTFVGTTGTVTPTAGIVSFSSNNGITVVATSANNLAVSTSQDLRTTASPTFAGLTLTAPLALSQGGTGATSAAAALTSILPTGTTAGYVLTTGGPGNFYWAAGSGGGGGTTPGTSINSTRLSYTANGVAGYTGNTFTTPTFTTSTQVRTYINGVRQFESEYNLNQSANTISFTTTPSSGDSILVEVDGYYVNPYYANNITFTAPFGGIVSSANTIQLALQDLETRKAALANASFTGVVTGLTLDANVSNTAFATTAFVKNVLNSGNTFSHTAAFVTNGVYTTDSGTVSSTMLSATGVTSGSYGGTTSIPVITVDTKGRLTSVSTVGVVSTSIIANTGQITANATSGIVALGLSNTTVTPGTYGGATQHSIVTVDQQGRVTSAANVTPSIASTQITGTITNSQLAGSITSDKISSLSSTLVTSALGFTPYDSANPNGYITSSGTATNVTNALGISQTYQQPSRSSGTSYTNSTSKPIWVWYAATSATSGATTTAYVDGRLACYTLMDLYPRAFAGFVVPPGSSYYINCGGNLAYWIELR